MEDMKMDGIIRIIGMAVVEIIIEMAKEKK